MSFFEKLKKEVGIEIEEKAVKAGKPELPKTEASTFASAPTKTSTDKKTTEYEGQLTIDVYETERDFVIQSTIAGLKAEDLDVTIENDRVTIRGSRNKPELAEIKNYLYQECYWGTFSRQIILPEEVDSSRAEAVMKDGVFTLRIPKIQRKKRRKIVVRQEE